MVRVPAVLYVWAQVESAQMNKKRINELIEYNNKYVEDKWIRIILQDILHHLLLEKEIAP